MRECASNIRYSILRRKLVPAVWWWSSAYIPRGHRSQSTRKLMPHRKLSNHRPFRHRMYWSMQSIHSNTLEQAQWAPKWDCPSPPRWVQASADCSHRHLPRSTYIHRPQCIHNDYRSASNRMTTSSGNCRHSIPQFRWWSWSGQAATWWMAAE